MLIKCCFWVVWVNEPGIAFSTTLLIDRNKLSEICYSSKFSGASLLKGNPRVTLGQRKENDNISQFTSEILIFTESPIHRQADFSQNEPSVALATCKHFWKNWHNHFCKRILSGTQYVKQIQAKLYVCVWECLLFLHPAHNLCGNFVEALGF